MPTPSFEAFTETTETDHLVLGAGVTGLAAGLELGNKSIILEKEAEPGGLVRTHRYNNGYWFDRVLHLLHFRDPEIELRIKSLLGNLLTPCPPIAWIESQEGVTKYPFQLNLSGLNTPRRIECIADYAKAYYATRNEAASPNYRTFLENTFGAGMCNEFFFPYNEKLYKYDLALMTSKALKWNLSQPSVAEVLAGAFHDNKAPAAYNSNAFYPCPKEPNAPMRGMQLLSHAVANKVTNLNLRRKIISIKPKEQVVIASNEGGNFEKYRFTKQCLSTLPLPVAIQLCEGAPTEVVEASQRLQHSRVISIAICVRGSRPKDTGTWRYYTIPTVPFTRLIFMNEFDPMAAPADGWAVLAEVPWPGRGPLPDFKLLAKNVVECIKNQYFYTKDSEVLDVNWWVVDPAYVVFTHETEQISATCSQFLQDYGISTKGRYGSWEYSSMYQNIKDGIEWARSHSKAKTNTLTK